MSTTCAACGQTSPAGFQFCGYCGAKLGAAPARARSDAERRRITVLFCDLVASTALSERLDPEEFRDVVRDYQAACTSVIDRYGGYVAQHLGDGLMVYFGFPRAHEDDARRAVHGGLGILSAVRALNEGLEGRNLELAVRVGIHAGPVVTGEVGAGERREQLALGNAPNVAARIQNAAEPNTVLLSADVHRVVQGFFECDDLGTMALKGVSDPVGVFKVLRPSGARNQFEIAVSQGLSPLVGRDGEVERLAAALVDAEGGRPRVVTLAGEAGIGKSRLVAMMREREEASRFRWLVGRCSPFDVNTAFHPMIDLVSDLMELSSDDEPAARGAAMAKWCRSNGMVPEETVPLLGEVLDVPTGEFPATGWSPERQKERMLDVLLEMMTASATRQPIVILIEDLHWADASTLDFLARLVQSTGPASLCTVLTYRPTFTPTWDEAPHHDHLTVGRLSNADVRTLVTMIGGERHLPGAVMDRIVDKTDGVPIFVEELTKMVLESGGLVPTTGDGSLSGTFPALAIPATLQDSLLARLDRLEGAKDIALLGAVIGREFPYRLLAAVSDRDANALEESLRHLVEADLLHQEGDPPEAVYTFRHALLQDAAYGLLLKPTRQAHHRDIAKAWCEQFPDVIERRPELPAYHFSEADMPDSATEWWLRAARRSAGRYANAEAIGHATRGMEQLGRMAPSAARDGFELALQTTLGRAAIASRGYGAPEVRSAFDRAVELSSEMGVSPGLFFTVNGLWMFHVVSGEYQKALELGGRLVELAETLSVGAMGVEAHYAVGFTRFYLGEFAAARDEFERALSVDVDDTTEWHLPTGDDPRVHALCFLSLSLWHLGRPDEARRRMGEAMQLAESGGHPHGIAFAAVLLGWLHAFLGDRAAVEEFAGRGLALAEDKGYSYWIIMGRFLLTWSKAFGAAPASEASGHAIEGMQRILAAYRTSGSQLGQTLWLCYIVSSCARDGRTERGLALIDEAFEVIERTGERSWEAEFHRLRGILLVETGKSDSDAVEGALTKALDTARSQGAESLVLRSAVSLGRFWAARGKRTEAARLVGDAYAAFREGYESADLAEAKMLLDQLD